MPRKRSNVKFARGFKCPSKARSIEAIGNANEDPWITKCVWDSFQSIPNPTSNNDWLAQYAEDGQDVELFIQECPWLGEDEKNRSMKTQFHEKKVYLVQIGDFGDEDNVGISPNFELLAEFASLYFDIDVVQLGKCPVDEHLELTIPEDISNTSHGRKRSKRQSCFKIKHRKNGERIQLDCPFLSNKLKVLVPEDGVCLIGLTMFDLYEAQPDLFVAGLASPSEKVALFSFARYDPAISFSSEFWYEWKIKTSFGLEKRKSLILERSCKLLVHELGHLLGLDHCIFFSCCMNGSGHLEEDFRQPIFLCPVCLHKVKILRNVNIEERYHKMMNFFRDNSMNSYSEWIENRMALVRTQT